MPHAVGEVDVHVSGGTEHHAVAGRGAAIGVGARVVRAVVGLDLREAQGDRTVGGRTDEVTAEQILGHLQDRAVEEGPGEGRTVGGRDHALRA